MFRIQFLTAIIALALMAVFTPAVSASPAADASVWSAEYYNNITLAGPPALMRGDRNLDFAWDTGISPAPGYVSHRYYSVRWTRELYFNATGNWVVTTLNDDGMRVWIDNRIAMDAWYDQGPTNHAGKIYLTAGTHVVRVEYYNRTMGGTARVSFALEGSNAIGVWHGQYYNNISLEGTPVLVRDDASLHFIWGTDSPGPGVPADYFSAKWDSVQILPVTGNYTVLVSSDDGVRVWIDGALVIDAWYDHSAALFSANRWLTAGAHNVHVEYYDRTVSGIVGVDITPVRTPAPAPAPAPRAFVVEDGGTDGWQMGGAAGNWHASRAGSGGQAYWTLTTAYSVPNYNWARWYPGLPGPGAYEVQAYIPGGIATTENARYWVYHGGRFDMVRRDQTRYNNEWMSLGTFYFSGAGDEYVSLSDVTYECDACRTVVFDAVKFIAR